MKAVAMFALWLAICSYDSRHQISLDCFVKSRVKAALLQRYREEWRFANRCCQLPADETSDEESTLLAIEGIPESFDESVFWWRIEIRNILARLDPIDHYLLERLFIDGASESEIAKELGISQPTVNRWKKEVLKRLRHMLEEKFS